MKKIKYLLILCLLICLGSCKKVTRFNDVDYGKIDYYVAGIYIQVEEYTEFNMNDANPKIYFNFSSSQYFGMFTTSTGYGTSAAAFHNASSNVDDQKNHSAYYAHVNMSFVNSKVSKVKLFPIYVNENNELVINEELSDSITISGKQSYPFHVEFTNNEHEYDIRINLSINK